MTRIGTVFVSVTVAAAGVVWGPVLVRTRSEAGPPAAPEPVSAEEPEAPRLRTLAVADGIRLEHPAEGIRGVAFHEASMAGALRMRPFGLCDVCRNRSKFRPPPVRGDGEYVVMDTRGRSFPATSAMDVVLESGAPMLSPVSGTVRRVRRYRLYGVVPDVRVAIQPVGARGEQVVMIHLRSVRVGPGDRVVAGETPVGWARPLPFHSQVDRYVRGGSPHVHLEVVDARTRRKEE